MNSAMDKVPSELFDFIIVGAGISGINTAYRIQTELPSSSYAILEARGSIGGTWDLFKYPGFRSDSELYTFGFAWRPWTEEQTVAEADSILKYMRESAAKYRIDEKVLFHHRLVSANWSTKQQTWNLLVDEEGSQKYLRARFVVLGTGFYDYHEALSSYLPGIEKFTKTVAHPQFWPEDLDYRDKKVVVVGSGSTAVTLIPAMAKKASHVTMLQRSPSYIVPIAAIDPFGRLAKMLLPHWAAHRITRLKYIIMTFLFNLYCTYFPLRARKGIRDATRKELPDNVPLDPHFSPRYNPWEQRLCMCPDGDFFKAMRSGKASVVTDTIATVTETGIQLASGKTLDADIIVTATGLKLKAGGGTRISVDGVPMAIGEKYLWRTAMLQDLPNMATVVGYVDVPWTLGADVAATLIIRVMKLMKTKGATSAVPRLDHAKGMKDTPTLNISSTYVAKGVSELPKTGNKAPWMARRTYPTDLWMVTYGSITDSMHYENAPP